jgi:hypothetical protein
MKVASAIIVDQGQYVCTSLLTILAGTLRKSLVEITFNLGLNTWEY